LEFSTRRRADLNDYGEMRGKIKNWHEWHFLKQKS